MNVVKKWVASHWLEVHTDVVMVDGGRFHFYTRPPEPKGEEERLAIELFKVAGTVTVKIERYLIETKISEAVQSAEYEGKAMPIIQAYIEKRVPPPPLEPDEPLESRWCEIIPDPSVPEPAPQPATENQRRPEARRRYDYVVDGPLRAVFGVAVVCGLFVAALEGLKGEWLDVAIALIATLLGAAMLCARTEAHGRVE
jgi:hypothetical protein